MKQRSPPSYSFGSRTALGKKDNFPSPNSYSLPAVLGSKAVGKPSAASYSMTARSKIGSFHEDLQKVCLFHWLPNHSYKHMVVCGIFLHHVVTLKCATTTTIIICTLALQMFIAKVLEIKLARELAAWNNHRG